MKKLFISIFILSVYPIYSQDFPGEFIIQGKVTSGSTTLGIPGVNVKFIQLTPFADTIETLTDNQGLYSFTITDMNELNPEIRNSVSYHNGGSKPVMIINSPIEDKAEFIISDILGQEVHRQGNHLYPGRNSITIEMPDAATAIYITRVETSQRILINKLQFPMNNWGSNPSEMIRKSDGGYQLKKLEDYTYVLEFRDPTETHHPYLLKYWEPLVIPTDQIYNTPLLLKGNIEIPFINERNNQWVITNRDLLFYMMQVDYMLYSAIWPITKPILTHLNIQNLPPQYPEQQIREATLEILSETGLPLDSIWTETQTYVDPCDSTQSTVGYVFVDTTYWEYDFVMEYIICGGTDWTSRRFIFNKDKIELEYIKKFIKIAWFAAFAVGRIWVTPGYFTSEWRDTTITNLTETERNLYRFLFQVSDAPTWISPENIPENNFVTPNHKVTKGQLETLLRDQLKSYALCFKRVGNTFEVTKKYLDE